MATNITWHAGLTHQERTEFVDQKGLTLWFTGLSASGKSICYTTKSSPYRLDGDNVRFGLNKDLGFSEKDRNENIRRISEVTKLFADSGTVSITSFISPYRADRDKARELHEQGSLPFLEVYVDVPVEVAEERDPKGLYKKARAGEIPEFTGISAPYEQPLQPEIHIKSAEKSVEEAVQQIVDYLVQNNYITLNA